MRFRRFSIILTACLILCLTALPASAEETVASGSCGKKVSWRYTDNGILYISGTGAVNAYSQDEIPWAKYQNEFSSVVISAGVTEIPEGVLWGNNVMYVTFEGDAPRLDYSAILVPDDTDAAVVCRYPAGNDTWAEVVEAEYENIFIFLESGARLQGTCGDDIRWELNEEGTLIVSGKGQMPDYFDYELSWRPLYRQIRAVEIREGVPAISEGAFRYCWNLETVTVPASVTDIGETAFADCDSLKEVRFAGSAPEQIGKEAFLNATAKILYPKGDASWKAYKGSDFGGDLTWKTYVPEKEPEPEVMPGDVDGSGSPDFFDGMYVLQFYAGIIGESQLNATAADVDGSGSVDFFDGMYILQYYAGVIDRLPAES